MTLETQSISTSGEHVMRLGATSPKVILVADDNPTVRKLVARILRRSGYRVVEYEDGNSAHQALLADHQDLDLALMDSVMPGMRGEQVLESIRSSGIGLPVILISAYSEEELAIEADRREYFLPKPFRPWELLDLMSDALNQPCASQSGTS